MDELVRTNNFSGVVRVEAGGEVFEKAYGLAHRGYKIPNTVDTRFAIASGCKAFTALAVVSLIEQGTLSLDTRAREVLGAKHLMKRLGRPQDLGEQGQAVVVGPLQIVDRDHHGHYQLVPSGRPSS